MTRTPKSRIPAKFFATLATTGFVLLLIAANVSKARAQSVDAPPTIAPDKVSYSPGQTMVLTGANWLPGEAVTVVLCADSGSDGGTFEAVADGSGSFTVCGRMRPTNLPRQRRRAPHTEERTG